MRLPNAEFGEERATALCRSCRIKHGMLKAVQAIGIRRRPPLGKIINRRHVPHAFACGAELIQEKIRWHGQNISHD